MWLKYQQVSAKMASFDPREVVRGKDAPTTKHPLRRFDPTLRTSLGIVIPMNLERLHKHKTNIEKYAYTKKWKDMNMEQINASRTIQQLQATIRDLEKIRHQINEEDLDEFEKQVTPMKKGAFKAFHEMSLLQNLITTEVQKSINADNAVTPTENKGDSATSQLIDHPLATSEYVGPSASAVSADQNNEELFQNEPIGEQIQLGDRYEDDFREELAACHSWDQLRDGLIELNDLVKDFSAAVHHQQEHVDSIDANIEDAHDNVYKGATFLGQASKYKAAVIPIAGAVVGGLVGGPIGLLAGFKLAGAAAAVGGGIAGYQGGKYLKKKHDQKVDMELENLITPTERTVDKNVADNHREAVG